MIVVVNHYFIDAVLSGRKKTFMCQQEVKLGERVDLAITRMNPGKNDELIPFARVTVLHALELQCFCKTQKLVLAGLVLTREENLEIIKNEGFKNESEFWDAFGSNITCLLVGFHKMKPI